MFIKKRAVVKAERYKKCGKQEMGVFDIFPSRGKLRIVSKTGIKLVIETTWTFEVVCSLPGCCIVGSASVLPDKPSE